MLAPKITEDDVKWLKLVDDSDRHDRKHRPLPAAVQTRLRSYGFIELRHKKFVLTAAGQKALKAGVTLDVDPGR
jgi:hypothetical protein